jgi:hypothetical protein
VDSYILTGLLKIELASHTVLLCDGGTVEYDGDTYAPHDTLFGGLQGMDSLTEGVADEAPAFTLTFLPDAAASAADLLDPAHQDCRLRLWLAEIDADTGLVTGTPDQFADALIDVPRLRFPADGRILEGDCVSGGQRLMNRNEANVLNGGMHKRIYSSETGMDDTTGVQQTFAWGISAARGTTLNGGAAGRTAMGRGEI